MKIKNNIAVSESGFMFNPSSGDSYSVNPIGQEIISLYKEGKTDKEVIAEIVEDYAIDADTIEKDLYDFKVMLSNYKIGD